MSHVKRKVQYHIIVTTVANKRDADHIADAVIAARLAACVQYCRIRSVYRWKGKVESTPEFRLEAKTRAGLAHALMAFIRARHPYEVPEIVALPLTAGHAPYLRWISDETRPDG